MNTPLTTIQDATLSLDDVAVDHLYLNCTITFSNSSIHVSDVTFDNCTFSQSDFTGSSFDHVTFQNCNLQTCNFSKSALYFCKFLAMQLTGFTSDQAKLKNISFTDCKLTYSNFSDSVLEQVAFNQCLMIESSFQNVTVKKSLTFIGSEIDRSDFIETKLKNVSLVDAQFDQLVLDPALVQGLKIDNYQATQLISMFGIIIQ